MQICLREKNYQTKFVKDELLFWLVAWYFFHSGFHKHCVFIW
jgi:hypothetical protein